MFLSRRLLASVTIGSLVAAATSAAVPWAAVAQSPSAPSFDTTTPVTIVEWDTESEPGPSAEMDALNEAFHQRYPNVTISRTAKSFDDYMATIRLAASAPDAPDVYQGNEGYSVDGALVKAGLIVPLDDYAASYGWETRLDPLDARRAALVARRQHLDPGPAVGHRAEGRGAGRVLQQGDARAARAVRAHHVRRVPGVARRSEGLEHPHPSWSAASTAGRWGTSS